MENTQTKYLNFLKEHVIGTEGEQKVHIPMHGKIYKKLDRMPFITVKFKHVATYTRSLHYDIMFGDECVRVLIYMSLDSSPLKKGNEFTNKVRKVGIKLARHIYGDDTITEMQRVIDKDFSDTITKLGKQHLTELIDKEFIGEIVNPK
ncbi:hypothetical protein HYO65_gp052 [Tenacibaculum phage PTm1]|uniref:Uncharacterized protein n=2 Tax=Shirahamavirus PTm1 TaxID=2846435 RepID=A0A5S9C0Z8_9CAUD|nr:hypothetical protein HYO65_gp052 [Tenacibaculum phage PTm1]BBI90444.1 hypothetical protein [Tenacibaculum phage PTm1]BBI90752.1 hypothetical protein [Tenacibaculum phage PTm5]